MERRYAAIAAFLGLLTAIVVLLGSLTDQGWLPSFVKEPVQDAVRGAPQDDAARAAPADQPTLRGDSSTPRTPAVRRSPTGLPYGPDTCIQGYVWREAVSGDHACVTPRTRDQAREDNRLADSRRSPTGGPYGPDTCVQGYVWRGAVPDDHVCVTPATRDQTQEDNRLAASRRAKG